ncbi:serine/threonine-protein kinase [Streptomyces gobiensis]|uniref:serine/threonine-protein kinase n=1 Tax=Streptomyces gobiensis TaxID=2875706 RepID=UPI001E3899A6|nr:serine/threonine-protein kinase [Streptomyces gobiensis]UGY90771.1 serine/threonine protein kinase [Streptomyces gobiensis]
MEALTEDDPVEVGGYRLLGRVGAGGMGRVYLGESLAGQQVAVKVIKPSVLDEESRARFIQEMASLKIVYGPCVADFVGGDAQADPPWLAVEYVPGPDLRGYVTEHGPLPLVETASLGALLAEGLVTVHQAGLLHRDLKPQNVLLDAYGPKVIDFGLAVLAERRSTLTATGYVVGTVQCMPPEQARGERKLTPAADVYALGAVLLYAVTGHYPYDGGTWQAIALKIEDPATPPDLTGLPRELRPLMDSMLAADPEQRPELRGVAEGLVEVLRAEGTTPGQAKRRLASRTASPGSEPVVPDSPVVPRPAYTPTLVDAAGIADVETASAWADPEAEPGGGPQNGSPPTGSPAVADLGSTDVGMRRSAAPLEIAERLRSAYAREAPFVA